MFCWLQTSSLTSHDFAMQLSQIKNLFQMWVYFAMQKKSLTYCSSTAHNQIMLIAGCGLGLAQVTQIQFGGIHIMFHFRDITFY